MTLVCIVSPLLFLLAYLFLSAPGRFEKLGRWWAAVAFVTAVLSSVPAIRTLSQTFQWAGSTEIAWTGLESSAPSELQIGGPPEGEVVGWPNGAFSPQLNVSSLSRGDATVRISRGSGFVENESGAILNGFPLFEGVTHVSDFDVLLKKGSWPLGPVLEVQQNGNVLAQQRLPRPSEKGKVFDVGTLMEPSVVRLRDQNHAAWAAQLEGWAANFRLLSVENETRLLDRRADANVTAHIPLRLKILWPNITLPIAVRFSEQTGRLRLSFIPPLRLSSPLPPATPGDKEVYLVFTGRVLPGDTAVLFPLGGELAKQRETVVVKDNVFPSAPVLELPHPFGSTPLHLRPDVLGVTSEHTFRADAVEARVSYFLTAATINDVPRPTLILAVFAIALLLFGCALWLAGRTLRERDGALLGGIATCLWAILVYRFLLSCRFALDPSTLDQLAVSGLVIAAVSLVLLPALVLIAAKLHRDRFDAFFEHRKRVREGLYVSAYLVVLVIAAIMESRLAVSLWPNAAAFSPTLGPLLVLFFAAAGFSALGYIVFTYVVYDIDQVGPDGERLAALCHASFLGGADLLRKSIKAGGKRIWNSIGVRVNSPDDLPSTSRFGAWVLGTVVLELVVFAFLYVTVALNHSGSKLLQEIVAPLAFCWLPAFFWLASRYSFPSDRAIARFFWWRGFFIACVMLLIPVFVLPLALHDAGGLIATFSVFFPTVALLCAGRKPWQPAVLAMVALLAALSAASFIYLNLETVLPRLGILGQAGTRLLVFQQDSKVERLMIFFPLSKSEGNVTFSNLSNGLQHTWENRALIHEGGWLGLGFGNAPTRRSHVRQDTLEYDSTFGFFVASEEGLLGGLFLILLYAVPLFLVFWSGKDHFDMGHAVAAVIAAAFFLEALFHILMNLDAIPVTGRSLPLLAVNSNSDAMKWGILYWIAAQALMWRVDGPKRGYYAESYSVLSGYRKPSNPGKPLDAEPRSRFRRAVAALSAVILGGVLFGAYHGVGIVRNNAFGETFDWTGLLAAVKQLANAGKLWVNQDKKEIGADLEYAPKGSLLAQEIARFNALSEDERMEGMASHVPLDFRERMRRVASWDDYQRLLSELKVRNSEEPPHHRPTLFRLVVAKERTDEQGELPQDVQYRVEPNPTFNTQVSFHARDFPVVSYRDGLTGSYQIRGPGFDFVLPDRPSTGSDVWRAMDIEQTNAGLVLRSEPGSESPRVRLSLRVHLSRVGGPVIRHFGDYERTVAGLFFSVGKLAVKWRSAVTGSVTALEPERRVQLGEGDSIFLVDPNLDINLSLQAHRISHGALIGPAWANGRSVCTYNPDPALPWTLHYMNAILGNWKSLVAQVGKDEANRRLGTLSFDGPLQQVAAKFVAHKGPQHYDQVLKSVGRRRESIWPTRAALTVLSLSTGEVLAMSGWPRMTPTSHWQTIDAELLPPVEWVETRAPASLQVLYDTDRNFDRIPVGSATKPIWASAVLRIHPGLDRMLCVRGPAALESDVFGITLSSQSPWHVEESRALRGKPGSWANFESFLARSDNRYQVRLGFLGLTNRGAGGPLGDSGSNSSTESLDGGVSLWHRFPQFNEIIGLSNRAPSTVEHLQATELAEHLHNMYSIGVASKVHPNAADRFQGVVNSHRISFWSGNEIDDRPAAVASDERAAYLRFAAISPEAVNFELDQIHDPRSYVSLLLGGGANRWANVDLAAAFATCITGHPVVAHATLFPARPHPQREDFESESGSVLPGLRSVIESDEGTAHSRLAEALQWIHHHGWQVYAKTGTLAVAETSDSERSGRAALQKQVSRIVLAIVQPGSKPSKGLVFSMVVESAELGTATQWLNEFIASNESGLERLMKTQ
jgi:cell division protein FtsW (lipid II flippase)